MNMWQPDKDLDKGHYSALALADADGVQSFQYRGKTWKADDVYDTMTAAEDKNVAITVDLKYIVQYEGFAYKVLRLGDNKVYSFYTNCGNSFSTARRIAQVLNESE